MNKENQKGITLIALIITIIVMLILVAVAVNTAVSSGLFGHAKNATNQWADEQRKESEIGSDIDDVISKYIPEDMKKALENFTKSPDDYKHPDQDDENEDRAIGTDGRTVNLDLWRYYKTDDGLGISLGRGLSSNAETGYIGNYENGTIQGNVPQYIFIKEENKIYPVVSMESTFYFGYSDNNKGLITAPEIPSTVEYLIGTFDNCINLETVIIPNNITNIGNSAFSNCTSLSNINIPNSIINIGAHAFRNCTSLSNINIPNSIINIGDYAFGNCTNIKSICIPNSVTDIGYAAFAEWNESQEINCQVAEKPTGWSSSWDYFDWLTPRKAQLNWNVNM